jgi:hypothetical protein
MYTATRPLHPLHKFCHSRVETYCRELCNSCCDYTGTASPPNGPLSAASPPISANATTIA